MPAGMGSTTGAPASRRVVITGLGLVTPIGIGVTPAWSALCKGVSGVAEITHFDTAGFTTRIAAEVKDFRPQDFLVKKEVKRTERFIAFGVAAARMALKDAGFTIQENSAHRIGVLAGCALGGLSLLENTHTIIQTRGPERVSPFFIPMMIGNMAAGMISIYLGAKGPNASIATACAAGTHAIGDAVNIIRNGKADAMIAGGVESLITPTCVAGFNALKALSTRNESPETASRPFDKTRDGFVLGEGGGMLLIESLDSALGRGARIYAEISGYGMSGDAYHITAPPPDGDGAARCMQAALQDSGLCPETVDYINAHGTGTQINDIAETRAIKTVFGRHAARIPVSATKSMTGHLLGGAGGVEAVFTTLSLYHGILPPTINLTTPDEECDLDYVPQKARKASIATALTNSFGFGGTNACLVLRKIQEAF